MNHVKMISTGTHRYEGVWLYNGDHFNANSEQDADELKILGFAKRAPAAQTYQTRVMTAASPAAPSVAETPTVPDVHAAHGAATERQKRPYNRKVVAAQ